MTSASSPRSFRPSRRGSFRSVSATIQPDWPPNLITVPADFACLAPIPTGSSCRTEHDHAAWPPLISAVAGHHGAPPEPRTNEDQRSLWSDFGRVGIEAAHAFVEQAHLLLAPPQEARELEPRRAKRRVVRPCRARRAGGLGGLQPEVVSVRRAGSGPQDVLERRESAGRTCRQRGGRGTPRESVAISNIETCWALNRRRVRCRDGRAKSRSRPVRHSS